MRNATCKSGARARLRFATKTWSKPLLRVRTEPWKQAYDDERLATLVCQWRRGATPRHACNLF